MKSLVSFISEGPEEKKKDKLRVLVISKQMKKPADAKRVLGSQIVFEDSEDQVDPNPSKTMSKLFSHVRKLMAK